MPPPRKVDLLPPELRAWLKEVIEARGGHGWEDLAAELNAKLQAEGVEITIGKSALHTFGTEHLEFVRYQEEASRWAADWMQGNGLKEEAQRHNVLFQMITTLAFKVMKSMQTREGEEIDPRELSFLGKMLKDVMSSSGMREKMRADERKRIAAEATAAANAAAAEAVDASSAALGLSADTVEQIKSRILGVG